MKIVAWLATFAATCALAGVLAWWVWQLVGPSPMHIPVAAPADPAATIIASGLFGGAAPQVQGAGAASGATLGAGTRLLGIVAEPRQRGFALFRLPSGPKVVAAGEEISPGVRVTGVDRDAVTLRDGSGEQRVALRQDEKSLPGPAAPLPSGAALPSAARAAIPVGNCAPPAGFQGAVVRLNTELLGGLARDSSSWQSWLVPVQGGLEVHGDNGFAAMLGLKAGDRIAQANGIALMSPADVTGAVLRPLAANQGVRLTGARNGALRELWLANVACSG